MVHGDGERASEHRVVASSQRKKGWARAAALLSRLQAAMQHCAKEVPEVLPHRVCRFAHAAGGKKQDVRYRRVEFIYGTATRLI